MMQKKHKYPTEESAKGISRNGSTTFRAEHARTLAVLQKFAQDGLLEKHKPFFRDFHSLLLQIS